MTTITTEKKKPAAFVLGKRPETVPATVAVPMPDGTISTIECKFAYRTRTEFAKFWDALGEASKAKVANSKKSKAKAEPDAPEQPEDTTFETAVTNGNRSNADNTLQFLSGWNLDCDLTPENLMQMFDEVPAAPNVLWDAYRVARLDGRLGN